MTVEEHLKQQVNEEAGEEPTPQEVQMLERKYGLREVKGAGAYTPLLIDPRRVSEADEG